MLKTRARCLVFDPNSDFRCAYAVQEQTCWTESGYDKTLKRGLYPTEANRGIFQNEWKNISITIESLSSLPSSDYNIQSPHRLAKPRLPWSSLPPEFPVDVLGGKSSKAELLGILRLISLAQQMLLMTGVPDDSWRKICGAAASALKGKQEGETKIIEEFATYLGGPIEVSVSALLNTQEAKDFCELISGFDEKLLAAYLASIREMLENSSVISLSQDSAAFPEDRLRVVDIASVADRPTKLALVWSTLDAAWKWARKNAQDAMETQQTGADDPRKPLFIVVDEAHHLIPSHVDSELEKRVLAKFREIATEGRKICLHLILATQRPDRLDMTVAGECQNIALMGIKDGSAVAKCHAMLALPGNATDLQNRLKYFLTGQCLISGPWKESTSDTFFTALRRTREGGRNIRPEAWLNEEPTAANETAQIAVITEDTDLVPTQVDSGLAISSRVTRDAQMPTARTTESETAGHEEGACAS